MTTATDKRRALRALLATGEVFPAPGCADPVSARLSEHMGFKVVHAAGSSAHRSRALADESWMDLGQMTDHLRFMCDAVDIPTIGDGDTGFGGPMNTVRMVRDYERAGAAAIHIQDQGTPKREGEFVSRQEMVDRIWAAVDARVDPELIIVARCEVSDLQERQDRMCACLEAGADVGWLSGRDAATLRSLRSAFGKPAMGVVPGKMTLGEYGALGGNCACLAATMLAVASLLAQKELLDTLLREGSARPYLDSQPAIDEMTAFYLEQGEEEARRLDGRLPSTIETP